MSLRQIMRNLDEESEKIVDALLGAVYAEALDVLRQSKRRVPVDTSATRQSGYANPPDIGTTEPTAEVGYGTEYALALHERVEVFHKVGQPLFLSSVINELKSKYADKIATRTKRFWRQGKGLSGVPQSAPTKPPEAK